MKLEEIDVLGEIFFKARDIGKLINDIDEIIGKLDNEMYNDKLYVEILPNSKKSNFGTYSKSYNLKMATLDKIENLIREDAKQQKEDLLQQLEELC